MVRTTVQNTTLAVFRCNPKIFVSINCNTNANVNSERFSAGGILD